MIQSGHSLRLGTQLATKGAIAKFTKKFPIFSATTVAEVSRRGLLQVSNSREWRYGDARNGTTRRLHQPKFKRCDNKGRDWHRLIGLDDVIEHDRPLVVFVLEGSTDSLAAFELANRSRLLPQIGIVTSLGAGYRPIGSELDQLAGRKVLLIGDRDEAGIESVRRVSHALCQHDIDHVALNWNSFPKRTGKDLFDLLKKTPPPVLREFFSFFFPPSDGSTVQRFNGSTNTVSSSTNIHELVAPFVMEKPSTGNARAFALARALRGHEATSGIMLTNEKIDAAFHDWFTRSRSLLPPGADEEKGLRHFYKQIRRVRYLPCALDAAMQRARSLPPPEIPGADDPNVLKVGALMRELQREAGDKSFICPVNIVVSFVPLRFAEQAKRIQHVLEKKGAVTCVERGAPHLPGKPGKSSVWRYNLPLGAGEITGTAEAKRKCG